MMHPVLNNLWSRREKHIPIDDNRHIALVIFGGTMTGIRGSAALVALEELGLARAFDSIYSVSAGFPNASYFLSGNIKEGVSVYFDELTKHRFVSFFRLWRVMDIQHLVAVCKHHKPLNVERILKSPTRLYVRIVNKNKNTTEYLEVHRFKKDDYFKLLHAATSVPFLNPGTVTISGTRYMDIAIYNDDPLDHIQKAISSEATDILIVYNHERQRRNIQTSKRIFEICPPGEWKLNRIEKDPEALKAAAQQMGTYVKKQFGINKGIVF